MTWSTACPPGPHLHVALVASSTDSSMKGSSQRSCCSFRLTPIRQTCVKQGWNWFHTGIWWALITQARLKIILTHSSIWRSSIFGSVPKCSLALTNTLVMKVAILWDTPAARLWFKSNGSSIDINFEVHSWQKINIKNLTMWKNARQRSTSHRRKTIKWYLKTKAMLFLGGYENLTDQWSSG